MDNGLQPLIPTGSAWHYSWLDLSSADMIVVGLMIVVFVLAIVLPFPGGDKK